jgi:ABC-2 type transport system ATP-binding protein
MRRMVRAHAAQGNAVLVSSHLLAEVAQSVDDVVVIADGELRGQGTLEEVLGGGAEGPVTEVSARDSARLASAVESRGYGVERNGDALLVLGATPEQVGLIAAEEQVPLLGLAPRSRSLEAAFFELTGEAR